MTHIVILGAGFGGITVATELRPKLDEAHRIIVVDRKAEFMMGLRKLWILTGAGTRQEGSRHLAALADQGIDVVRGEIQAINPHSRQVDTSAGTFAADLLVVAMGADPDPHLVPGFTDYNVYNQYDVSRAAKKLAGLKRGRVLVGILGLPYKCPPAPYECTFLVDDYLRRLGLREDVALDVFTPQPIALPVAGADASAMIQGLLAERGIGFHASAEVAQVANGHVDMTDGRSLPFDLLLGVPPHRCPAVVAESGLTDGKPWVSVSPFTLKTRFDHVWAIGDVAGIPLSGGSALPKAGVFAAAQGRVVAAQILSDLHDRGDVAPYDGAGYCYMELGGDQAAKIEGAFYAEGGPAMTVQAPSTDAFQAKQAFERDNLSAWFGTAP
jgi:sulfide:quinone oxidoreductase